MKKGDTKTSTSLKSLRLKNEVIKKIEVMAEKDNRTFTNMVETILIRESEKDKNITMM
jgi:predicted DNA-binding ribbon-helix-helix protein